MEYNDTSHYWLCYNVGRTLAILGRRPRLCDHTQYVTPVLLLSYTAAYFLLRDEDEVNDGLSDFSPGQNIKDTPAFISLVLVALMGGFYCLRALLDPGSVADLVEAGAQADGLGTPSNVTVAVGGSLFLVYFLWTLLTILDGASGKWAIIHPGIFALLAATIQSYVSYVDDEARRTITDATIQDAVAGPLALLLVLFSYYRLRPEGIEDGMTYSGEEWPNKAEDFNVMVIGFNGPWSVVHVERSRLNCGARDPGTGSAVRCIATLPLVQHVLQPRFRFQHFPNLKSSTPMRIPSWTPSTAPSYAAHRI